jgi:Cu(I)/Ag(I) efflux system protein CusF
MKSMLPPVICLALLAGPVCAQTPTLPPSDARATSGSDRGAAVPARIVDGAEGEVRRIDRDTGRLTLRHGEIRHLEMPAMTMVFQVQTLGLLDGLKVGDKVRFRAERAGSGYQVTQLEVLRE